MSLQGKPLESVYYLQTGASRTHVLEGTEEATHLCRGLIHVGKGAASTLALLAEEAELALLGNVAELTQTLDGLLARRLLTAADDTTTLGLHEILLSEATGSVAGSAVEDLRLGTYGLLRTTLHGDIVTACVATVLARVATSVCHFSSINADFFHLRVE
jgi:hypothetical protein